MDFNTQRQMPCSKTIVKEKNYCDLLYAWLQCNSEKAGLDTYQRRIEKKEIKWQKLEREFTRKDEEGKEYKLMTRKTIAKYFQHLLDSGLIEENEDYYYLKMLDRENGHLIEYKTLEKLMLTLQRNSLNIYIYLFNRYCANGNEPVIVTAKQIKEHLGLATSTTSNNAIISSTIDILRRLGLLNYKVITDEQQHQHIQYLWVKNKFPSDQ